MAKILIVEDNPANMKLALFLLESVLADFLKDPKNKANLP